MKKLFLLFILAFGMTYLGWGQPFYDGFIGTGDICGHNGWIVHSGTGIIPINTGSLSYTGLLASTGNRVTIPGSNATVSADVNAALTIGVVNVAYYSVLINVIDNTQLSATTADYFMSFGATSGTPVTILAGRLGIKKVNTGGVNYRLSIGNTSGGTGNPTYTDFATDLVFGTTYLIVVKYDRSVSPTVASLWVNPSSLGGTEPSGSVSNSSGTSAFASFASICIRNGTNTPKADIDEIRAGITWAAVTPVSGATIPTVTTQAVTAIGTITATGNGNITFTGGSNSTSRGFCYDIYANPDPDLGDSHTIENGSFGTGAFTGSISSLSAETRYKAVAYATNGTGTGYGSAVNFWTLSLEPSTHTTTFSNTIVSQTQINLSFDAASTITNADGYIILMKSGSAPTGTPADGSGYSVNGTIGDGTVVAIVTSNSSTSANITGLSAGTHYYFTIFPYNYNGTDNVTYNYKTDGTIPGTDGTTNPPNDVNSYVNDPGTQANPGTISSLVDTDPEAVEVFKFKINDVGTDGLLTKVTQVTIKPGTNNVANWTTTIQGVKLSTDGGITFVTTGTPTISATSIVFPITSGDLNVINGSNVTVSLFIYLKNSGLTDNQVLEFTIPTVSHGFIADATGSTFLTTFATATTSNQMTINVVATKLNFVQQPSNTFVNATMSPAVTIEATDANNNRDLDKTGSVALVSSGTMTGPVTASLASGLGTFGNIVHTVTGTDLTLTASLSGLSDAVSNLFSIATAPIAGWDFTDGTANPIGVASHITVSALSQGNNNGTTTLVTTTSPSSGYTGASGTYNAGAAARTGVLTTGASGSAYFEFTITPADRYSLTLTGISFGARSTSTGPQSYTLRSSADAYATDIATGSISNNSTWILKSNTGLTFLTGSAVTFRIYGFGGTGSASANTANWRIDDLLLFGDIVITSPTFTGTGNWTETARWNTGVVPGPSATVFIDGTATINSAVTVTNLTIDNTYSLTIDNGGALTVTGTFTNSAGTSGLVIKSNATGTGSLLHSNSGVAATVERYFTGASRAWHFLSSPVASQAISPNFTAADADYDFFAWYEQTGVWVNFKNTIVEPTWNTANGSTNFTVGKGYLVEYLGTGLTKQFQGNLNNGSVSFPLSNSGTGTYIAFNLAGNPYPSAIDWKASSGWTRTSLVSSGGGYDMSIWNDGVGQYGSFNSAGSSGTNGVTQYIPVAQGFMVKAASSGTLGMDNGIRVHDNQAWLKSTDEISNILRMKVTGNVNSYSDEIVIEFGHQTAIGGAEKMFSFYETAPSLYTVKPTGNYSIDFRGEPGAVTIPLSFKAGVDGTYTLTASQLESFTSSTLITLEDLQAVKSQNLMQNPSYTFTATKNDGADRFQLHFGGTFSVNEKANAQPITIYASGSTVYISNVSGTMLKGEVIIYNMIGQPLISQQLSENPLTKINLSGTTGYYLVKVITGDNTYSGKVFIN